MYINVKVLQLAIAVILFSLTFSSAFGSGIEPELDKMRSYVEKYHLEKSKDTRTDGWTFAFSRQGNAFTSSFGLANIEQQTPVSEDTVFRIASVSKVFVAIAVQQLIERGEIALDVDLSQYLPYFTPLKEMQFPITMLDLMAHTAGFDDHFYGDSERSDANISPLGEFLENHFPKQVVQPGNTITYSNYGYALAAYVVESVSGIPFHQYVQENILFPTGMVNSGYLLNDNLNSKLARGYTVYGDDFIERPYTYVKRYPPTSMLSTAADMVKFINMLTNEGVGENGRVLTSKSIDEMFTTLFTHDHDLPGMTLGWMEFQRYGVDAVYHDGGTPGFLAELVIIPSLKAGYFMATNQEKFHLIGDLRFDFLKTFFGGDVNTSVQQVKSKRPLADYAGIYRYTRRNHTTFEKLAGLMDGEIEISIDDNGDALVFFGRPYVSYSDNKFVHIDSGHKLVFKQKNDSISMLYLDWGASPRAYLKRDILEKNRNQLILVALIGFTLLISGIISALKVKRGEKAFFSIFIANSSLLVFFFGLTAYFLTIDPISIRFGEVFLLKLLLVLPLLSLLTFIYSLYKRSLNVVSLIYFTPCLTALIWLHDYNLIGWQFT